MKNKILTGLALILAVSWLFTSCETDMEKAQKDYDATQVFPKVLSISGPAIGLQTFSYTYKIGYYRAGSTWAWSATGATISSVSDDTRTASITFTSIPASGKAQISVTETTSGGVVSDPKVIEVNVEPFCPLAPSGFVGNWVGTDGMNEEGYFFDSEVVISDPTTTTVKVTGLNFGWIANAWGETITAGGTITMVVGNDGTALIEEQPCFTTDYNGDPYDYFIKGTATWSNCGATPTLNIAYVIFYADGYTLPVDWAGEDFPEFYAVITLDETKGVTKAVTVQHPSAKINFPPRRNK